MTLSGNIPNLKEKFSNRSSTASFKSNTNYERESEERKCQTEFLLITEKAIISFNMKKYQESYTYLENSGVIKNLDEFGEFLLVVSGFDKVIMGEFLAKEKPPNDKKEILNSFINSIDMNCKNKKIIFLDCLRFLLTRLILPKDANLILVIMDKFSEIFYNKNREDKEFLKIFKDTNAIYLLVSTILALNTMFTRKDIKNMNVIKKDEFKSMNKDIDPNYINKLYDELKKKPISLSGDYNEETYKKLSTLALVKTKDVNTKKLDSLRKGKTENAENNENSKNNSKKIENRVNMDIEDSISENKNMGQILMDQQYYDYFQDLMDLDITRKTLRSNYNRKKTFSINTNLYTFNENDKKLLKRPNKFYLIQGSSKPSLKEFIVFDEFRKLAFDKTIDASKQKHKKFIEIKDIDEVCIGINHNHAENIKKYIKAYPHEEKLTNNFISIVYNNRKEQLDIKTDSSNLAIIWFKAITSLVIQKKLKEEEEKIAQATNKLNEIREIIYSIWEDNILTHWENYGNYLIVKSYEKYNYFSNLLPLTERQVKTDLFEEKKILNDKTIMEFLKEINERLNKNQNNKLEYNEFFCLCYLGLPHKLRKKIWKIFIENNLCITKNLYLYHQSNIMKEKIDFIDLDFKYREYPNIQLNPDYFINKILIDIIQSRYLFFQEINENIDENELMQSVYKITIAFNIIRNDIPYNKGIISIIYFFLLAGLDEYNCLVSTANLICSSNTLKLFIGDKKTIKKDIQFFSIILRKYAEKVSDHLNKLEISPELYLIPWLEKLFTQTLNFNILLRIFDLYIINGEYILFQVAITIIKLLEKDLFNLTISEVFKMLKRLPRKYTELDFFEKFKVYNSIKDEYINWNKNNILEMQQKEINEIIKN